MQLKRFSAGVLENGLNDARHYGEFELITHDYQTATNRKVFDLLFAEGYLFGKPSSAGTSTDHSVYRVYRKDVKPSAEPTTKRIMIEVDDRRDALNLIGDLLKLGLDFEVNSKVNAHYSGNTAITLTADLLRIQLVERASREINKTIQIVEL